MRFLDILKVLVIGFVAPITYQLLNNTIGDLPVTLEKWSEILFYVVFGLLSLWKGYKYRVIHVEKKKAGR